MSKSRGLLATLGAALLAATAWGASPAQATACCCGDDCQCENCGCDGGKCSDCDCQKCGDDCQCDCGCNKG